MASDPRGSGSLWLSRPIHSDPEAVVEGDCRPVSMGAVHPLPLREFLPLSQTDPVFPKSQLRESVMYIQCGSRAG